MGLSFGITAGAGVGSGAGGSAPGLASGWHPTILTLLGLIVAEMIAFGLIARLLK